PGAIAALPGRGIRDSCRRRRARARYGRSRLEPSADVLEAQPRTYDTGSVTWRLGETLLDAQTHERLDAQTQQTHRGEQLGVTGLPVFTRPILPCCICASRFASSAHGSYRALWTPRLSRDTDQRA